MSDRLSVSQGFEDFSSDIHPDSTSEDRHWFAILKNNFRYSFFNESDSLLSGLLAYSRVSFRPPRTPTVLLGKMFPETEDVRELEARFEQEFREIIWCTYRSGFEAIRRIEEGELKAEYTSDVGWGCTLRVGQMLIANCMKRLSSRQQAIADILETPSAAFSVHRLVEIGDRHLDRRAGDWYAPSAVCHALKYLVDETGRDDVGFLVAMDGCIYHDQVYSAASGLPIQTFRLPCRCEKKARREEPSPDTDEYELFDLEASECTVCLQPLTAAQWTKPLLLTVPLMLGLGQVNTEYYEAVKFFLRLPQSAGIIGGRPKSALYFVGYQGDSLVFLDPHYVQKTCGSDWTSPTYTCSRANLLRLRDAESSMSVAFYVESLGSYESLCTAILQAEELTRKVMSVQPRTPGYLLGEDLPVQHEDRDFIVIDRI